MCVCLSVLYCVLCIVFIVKPWFTLIICFSPAQNYIDCVCSTPSTSFSLSLPFTLFFCSFLSASFFACLLFAIVGVWNISHTSMPAAVTRSVASSPNEGHAAIYVTPLYSLAPTHTLTQTLTSHIYKHTQIHWQANKHTKATLKTKLLLLLCSARLACSSTFSFPLSLPLSLRLIIFICMHMYIVLSVCVCVFIFSLDGVSNLLLIEMLFIYQAICIHCAPPRLMLPTHSHGNPPPPPPLIIFGQAKPALLSTSQCRHSSVADPAAQLTRWVVTYSFRNSFACLSNWFQCHHTHTVTHTYIFTSTFPHLSTK